MTTRPTASQINDDQLDALYAELEWAQEALSAREKARDGSGGAQPLRAAERAPGERCAASVGEWVAAGGAGRAAAGSQDAPQPSHAPDCPGPRERPAGARTGLHGLVGTLTAESEHHDRCAKASRIDEGCLAHSAMACGIRLATMHLVRHLDGTDAAIAYMRQHATGSLPPKEAR